VPHLPSSGLLLWTRGLAGGSDSSGAPEADTDLVTLHHDRYLAIALGEPQHLRQGLGIFFDIPINDGQPLFRLGLPGLLGKRSRLLAEDDDLLAHGPLLRAY
jgi:hypothetical protein